MTINRKPADHSREDTASEDEMDLPVLAHDSYGRPASDSVEGMFRQLVAEWDDETGDSPIVGNRFMHRAYQHIIGLGPDAVPLLLKELEREPDYWFWALTAITRENPVRLGTGF